MTELTFESTSKTVTTPTWNLHYNEAGEGDTTVVLLHGSGPGATGWSNFNPNIPALARHARVIALDMPGWGKSDPASALEYDHPVALVEFMDALGIDKATIVGNSMGGMTGLSFAARYPERIDRLVTMGPGAFFGMPMLFSPSDGPSEGLKVLRAAYQTPSFETMRRLVDVMTFDKKFASDELIQQRVDSVLANPKHAENALAAGWKFPVPNPASAKEVMSIACPALLLHGRDDRVMHYEHTLRLVSMIKDSYAVLINRCGHWLQLEHADRFNRLVIDFITD